jgi:hypothetical protein
MIQLTPDLCRKWFAPRMRFAPARSASYFLGLVLLFLTASCASIAAPMQSSENPSAKPAPIPAAQQPPATSPTSSPAASADSKPLQKAVHQKKVITEEDLAKPAKPISLSDLDGEENNPVCDLSCEAILRGQWGYGPEREAEFRNQLTLARHEIAADRVWNDALQSALRAAGDYCDIQDQKAKILGKGNAAPYVRDNVNSRFAERERKLALQYRESMGLLTQRREAIQRFASFRAIVMQYQVSEAAARVCRDYPLPSQ